MSWTLNADPSDVSQDADVFDSAGSEPDGYEPPEQSEPQEDPDPPVTGDGAEGFPVRGGGGS